MIKTFLKKVFGTQNERQLSKIRPIVERINALEDKYRPLSDEQLKEKIAVFAKELKKKRQGIKEEENRIREVMSSVASEDGKKKHKKNLIALKNQVFEEHLEDVFAVCREVARRTLGMRHFDVQLLGGMVLHQGKIAEMTTGEGKTLVATLPVCLNALAGDKVHVVTVNDYLAQRDAEWMGPVYDFFGLSYGVIKSGMKQKERKQAYSSNIVYGTNNEFGFDYLRDNMALDEKTQVQGDLAFAIVDEVDSILIDEARTPLIISGPVDETNESYMQMRPVVHELVRSQRRLVSGYLDEFNKKRKMANVDRDELGRVLYLIYKGDPKNRTFLDLTLKDLEIKKLFDRSEELYESKNMEKERDNLLQDLYYVFDERTKEATFNERGQQMMRERFNIEFMLEDIETELYKLSQEDLDHEERIKKRNELVSSYSEQQKKVESVKQLLKAFVLFKRDVDYVVKDNKVVIVDSFTGRLMPGRRFSDGLHESIEAKERVEVQRESQTLATITLQNYFRMYDKLSGMTGTAKTEETEFENIYLLPVIQVPTNKPLRRESQSDRIYKTEKEKFEAAAEEIAADHQKGRPTLVGTISIEKSEELSGLLRKKSIPHSVLNAKHHQREAQIVAQAGRLGAVTIATNMAGRGTDILLGGNPESKAREKVQSLEIDDPDKREEAYDKFFSEFEHQTKKEKEKVIELGGLHVIATERHESRRIDNQLRGRAGRQGDPGSSRFYLSLEDDLMRIFGSDRIKSVMERLGMEEGEVIENPIVSKAVRRAQKRVESQNFEMRKHLLKFDDVMNQQREVVYSRRQKVITEQELKDEFFECVGTALEPLLDGWEEDPDPEKLAGGVMYKFAVQVDVEELQRRNANDVFDIILEKIKVGYNDKEELLGAERMRYLEKMVMLSVIDTNWKEYLREIDELREGITWQSYGQRDPLVEFQHESFNMFTQLLTNIDSEIAEKTLKLTSVEQRRRAHSGGEVLSHDSYSALGRRSGGQKRQPRQLSPQAAAFGKRPPGAGGHDKDQTFKREKPKVGRNDPCPCGSGRKYKKCCGR